MNEQMLRPIQANDWVGKDVGGANTPLREKLIKLFGPLDFVRVKNIDNELVVWQYMPESKEDISFDNSTSTVPMKIVHREAPDVYQLEPGVVGIVGGASAYLMIELLVKKLMSKDVIRKFPTVAPGVARNFAFSDDKKQQDYIKLIFLGKYIPGQEFDAPPADNVDNDLGLNDEQPQGQYQEIGQPKVSTRKRVPR